MRVALLIAAAALAAGCGSNPDGRRIFARECAGCHTVSGREHGASGGDLAVPLLSVRDLVSFIATMPTRHGLSSRQVAAVAAYVRAQEEAARRARTVSAPAG